MRVEVKDLKKMVDLLIKNNVSLIDVYLLPHSNYLGFQFTDNDNTVTTVKLSQYDSGDFSKIIKEEIF